MATYKQIQGYVRDKEGFENCWIAHVKSDYGVNVEVCSKSR